MHDTWWIFGIAKMHGHSHFPAALAQNRLHDLEDVQVRVDLLQLPLVVQGIAQPFQIAGRVVHVGLRDLDVEKLG